VKKVNLSRVILGGIVAGTVVNLSEWALHDMVMREEFRSALGSLGRQNPEDIRTVVWWNVWGYILGITAVWLYAAIRTRYGPGIATALRAGVAVWILSCVLMTITMANLRLFPFMPMAFLWSLFGDLIGTVAGAWVYKEALA
jgi:hypothetical protein